MALKYLLLISLVTCCSLAKSIELPVQNSQLLSSQEPADPDESSPELDQVIREVERVQESFLRNLSDEMKRIDLKLQKIKQRHDDQLEKFKQHHDGGSGGSNRPPIKMTFEVSIPGGENKDPVQPIHLVANEQPPQEKTRTSPIITDGEPTDLRQGKELNPQPAMAPNPEPVRITIQPQENPLPGREQKELVEQPEPAAVKPVENEPSEERKLENSEGSSGPLDPNLFQREPVTSTESSSSQESSEETLIPAPSGSSIVIQLPTVESGQQPQDAGPFKIQILPQQMDKTEMKENELPVLQPENPLVPPPSSSEPESILPLQIGRQQQQQQQPQMPGQQLPVENKEPPMIPSSVPAYEPIAEPTTPRPTLRPTPIRSLPTRQDGTGMQTPEQQPPASEPVAAPAPPPTRPPPPAPPRRTADGKGRVTNSGNRCPNGSQFNFVTQDCSSPTFGTGRLSYYWYVSKPSTTNNNPLINLFGFRK